MRVRLRKRKLPSGNISLALVTNIDGHRRYETLNIFLTKDRHENKEKIRLADAIHAKRELDVHWDLEGILTPWRHSVSCFDNAEIIYRNKTPLTRQSCVNALDYLNVLPQFMCQCVV